MYYDVYRVTLASEFGADDDEKGKRDINRVPARWNPTPEQLQALQEIYRSGTRTPTAEQIQLIAAKLRRFGKIEGKNVFYWFQNHKARERQKRGREAYSCPGEPVPQPDIESLERKESGLSRRSFESGQTKNWERPSNYISQSEESVSVHRAVVAANECSQLERRESLRRGSSITVVFKFETNGISEGGRGSHQTLELFPLGTDDGNGEEAPTTTIANTNLNSSQFFEFLPPKN
ncbi:hypothetical protein RJ639_022754 [Escallonia herrerae]|uniref:Homeobox domain-containing protein n=1 Tax=Escallonia herrerae TaxID=1293975 RepID=A0AA88V007_9ASTE|nr:hypothetical protein RJ639_022754 [Escallonia herrerae]